MTLASPHRRAFGFVLSMLVQACSAASTQVPGDGGLADATIPDALADTSAPEASAPQCVHDPAASAPLPATATDTLPTGACDASQPACDLVVRQECTCEPVKSSIRIYYHCACRAGTWDCVETDIDTSVCRRIGDPDCQLDAGAAHD